MNYHDENALSCVINLAYLSTGKYYYKPIREFPAGKGYADLVYIPRKECADKPVLLIELKWDKSAETALKQIKEREYAKGLPEYSDRILLVGVNDKATKKHECVK